MAITRTFEAITGRQAEHQASERHLANNGASRSRPTRPRVPCKRLALLFLAGSLSRSCALTPSRAWFLSRVAWSQLGLVRVASADSIRDGYGGFPCVQRVVRNHVRAGTRLGGVLCSVEATAWARTLRALLRAPRLWRSVRMV